MSDLIERSPSGSRTKIHGRELSIFFSDLEAAWEQSEEDWT